MKAGTATLTLAIAILASASARAQTPRQDAHSGIEAKLLAYEPTGLSLLRPYERGKVPVVLIHGLWSSPASWDRMIRTLEEDRDLHARYQFWTFGYSTGDPIPYSACLLRRNLDEVRQAVDPDRTDVALDRMVLVGHSMGGLLTKMMAIDPGESLWRSVSDRPFTELKGDQADVRLLRDALFFDRCPEVRRVIFIATPHLGSRFDSGAFHRVGVHLVRILDPLKAAHERLIRCNDASFFLDDFRKGLPSSIDELEWRAPMLVCLSNLALSPTITAHSIIAVRPDPLPGTRTDGLVPFESASIRGVASEKVVSAGHLCQANPDVIAEVRRILAESKAP